VVTRRSQFRLERALNRLKIVQALLTALENVEDIVKILKESQSLEKARGMLIEKYQLNNEQATAISSMPLSRLTIAEAARLNKVNLIQFLTLFLIKMLD